MAKKIISKKINLDDNFQSWQSFSHMLSGTEYSTPQRSNLYKKYKMGEISERELDLPENLRVYLSEKKENSPVKSKTKAKFKEGSSKINYIMMKKRLLKFFRNFKGFSTATKSYITNEHSLYSLKGNIDYINKIRDSKEIEEEVVWLVEKTKKFENNINSGRLTTIVGSELVSHLDTLATLGEVKVASKIYQQMSRIDPKIDFNMYILFLHFPEVESEEIKRLRKRLFDIIENFAGFNQNEMDFMRKLGIYYKVKKYLKGNFEKTSNTLVKKYIKIHTNIRLDETLKFLPILVGFGEFDLVYNELKKIVIKTDDEIYSKYEIEQWTKETDKILYKMYHYFNDKYEETAGLEGVIDVLKYASHNNLLNLHDSVKLNGLYAQNMKKLETKNQKLKSEVKGLKDKITDLIYRPGGPGFLRAQSRQIGKMKR